jgi:CheY-like chemotaxis protein
MSKHSGEERFTPPSKVRPFRVLVVDDEPGMRETLVDILEAVGYSVSTAADGERALDVIRDHDFDVMVMDVQMPKRDGVSVLQQLRKPPPTVIMMTAYALEERLRAAVSANAFAILHKPFSVGHLLELVESASAGAA